MAGMLRVVKNRTSIMPFLRIPLSDDCLCSYLIWQKRHIYTTTMLQGSWMEKITGFFKGKPTAQPSEEDPSSSLTLLQYADAIKNAKRGESVKNFVGGKSSTATFTKSFEKQEAIARYLGGFDLTGEKLQTSQKLEAAKHCGCTMTEVENALTKFAFAKNMQNKLVKLKEEGKPMPTTLDEMQKLAGATPFDISKSSQHISRNSLCPCGSKKKYKRCCGKQ